MDLAVIDIGGTTIKFATWTNNKLTDLHSLPTPKTLSEFYTNLTTEVNKIKQQTNIKGVAISSPGAVNQKTGIIGGSSAVPYIHNFKITDTLEKIFKLPVSIENDANSAALGELAQGNGQGYNSIAFLVIGTGVGGALIIDHKIWPGAHLFGGEFGYMLVDNSQLSLLASPVNMAKKYNEISGKNLSGKTVFKLADNNDKLALKLRSQLIHALAIAIFNIQHSFDPEKIIIGGGISNNPVLIPLLNRELVKITNTMDLVTIMPDLAVCKLKSEANLRGAVENFMQNMRN